MVKKNKIIEKNDNEIKKLREEIKSLNSNKIFKIYNYTKKNHTTKCHIFSSS